jgi:hypothetical protein
MASRHGTQRRYGEGCRCEDCKRTHRTAAREYRQRRDNGLTRPPVAVVPVPGGPAAGEPGRVEAGVAAEIEGLGAVRPGVAATALALARLMDGPAQTAKPAAAKVLASLLDRLRQASAHGRRGNLALVRQMSEKGNASG